MKGVFFSIITIPESFLYKDVGLLPLYLKKIYNVNIKFIGNFEKEIKENFREMEVVNLKIYKNSYLSKLDKLKIFRNFQFLKYLIKKAKELDFIILFHYRLDKIPFIVLYKILNSNGKIYIKMDSNGKDIKTYSLASKIRNYILKIFRKYVDLYSIETIEAKNNIIESLPFGDIKNKLVYLPNGFDEEYLLEKKINILEFEKKENIILTVGRIGNYQKNNELLLEALEGINLKEWKVFIVGPYTEEFKLKYQDYILRNKQNERKIKLYGNVEDREKLYELYNKSKVFVLTSRWESYGLVLVEALRFGNYILTTDVGAAREITRNGEIGDIFNKVELKEKINEILTGNIDLNKKYNESIRHCTENFLWEKTIKVLENFI